MKKVLIAEDDKFLVNAYKLKLTKEGFDVTIAQDGEEAIDKLKTLVPDIILLDLVMPRKDGFAVLEAIQKIPALKAVPVIVASNLGQQEDLDRAKSLGAKDYIIKSDMPMSAIIQKINSHIK